MKSFFCGFVYIGEGIGLGIVSELSIIIDGGDFSYLVNSVGLCSEIMNFFVVGLNSIFGSKGGIFNIQFSQVIVGFVQIYDFVDVYLVSGEGVSFVRVDNVVVFECFDRR